MLRRLPLLYVLLLGTTLSTAHAEPASTESSPQDLMQQGIQLRRAGKDEEALRVFLDLERDSPESVRLLLQIAAAAQGAGRWLLASDYLRRAARYEADPYYQRHSAEVREISEAVNEHVGAFRAIGAPGGAQVLVDGVLIGNLPMSESKALEVGQYQLEVRAVGYYPLKRPLVVARGPNLTQESIELKPLPTASAGPGPASPDTKRQSLVAKPASEDPGGWRSRSLTWTLFGASGAAFVTSGIAFLVRENKVDHWNDESRCLDSNNLQRTRQDVCGSVRSGANTARDVGIIAGAVGVGLAAAASIQWWLSTPHESSKKQGVVGGCAVGLGALTCQGTF